MNRPSFIYILVLLLCQQVCFAAVSTDPYITENPADRTITISVPDRSMSLVIDYSTGCVIRQLMIKGQNVLSSAGVYTGIRTSDGIFSAAKSQGKVAVTTTKNEITISGIRYGNTVLMVEEQWHFKRVARKITWRIEREYKQDAELEDMAFPGWHFADLSVWKGGILDNGGMVWCKYLKQEGDTYGVHTGGVTFWNAVSGNALRISTRPENNSVIASKYTHAPNNEFVSTQLVTEQPLRQRYDLSRFVSGKENVFAPFKVKKGRTSVQYELQYIDYFQEYSRGTLPGIDVDAVRELLNTTGRYGVVDNNIIGANGWLTNWKCLHEPFFAQIGMALNDSHYTKNFSATLDQERDQAMGKDGRVLSRWHNAPGDEIPGTYNRETGYYEAMWGYTIDSQTGYVINTSEQFDLNGDLHWLRAHQVACEKALDWLIRRDENHNGIFEMVNNNIADKKCSDWLDIVWASYENAFVNAQLYEALTLWGNCEKVLGNQSQAARYLQIAATLKTAFNKNLDEGGFWSAEKNQYVYWRDKDGTVHGDNLVTPVNFAAIAFGLCDDPKRIALILDQIEHRTTAENLFHWPLCFDSFKQAEVQEGNWPFPRYENGDIFPTWGYLGVRAYVGYDKAIALKYIDHLLQQYKKDGLSSQRYSRTTQLGLGDDILAGICTSITALYRDIYGIRPKWNRMGIEPNMTPALNGTTFSYTLRDTVYRLTLRVNDYVMSTQGFSVSSSKAFGASKTGNSLIFYPGNQDSTTLTINAGSGKPIAINGMDWSGSTATWTVASQDNYTFTLKGLSPGTVYRLSINGVSRTVKIQADGSVTIRQLCQPDTKFILRKTA